MNITTEEIAQAIARARRLCPTDWQAELIEILLIPSIYKIWRETNKDRFPNLTITRHPGKPAPGTREENLAIGDRNGWMEIAGYEMRYGARGYAWNRARADYYGHSPASTWDGVRRETYCSFVEALRAAYHAIEEGDTILYRTQDILYRYQITLIPSPAIQLSLL